MLGTIHPKTAGATSDLSRSLDSFRIAQGNNPPQVLDKIEDLATKMRSAGMSFDDHMLYSIFIDALLLEYEVEPRNLASRDSIDHDDIVKAVDVEKDANEVGKAPTRTMVAPLALKPPPRTVVVRSRLPVVMAAAPETPKRMPPRGDVSSAARTTIGPPLHDEAVQPLPRIRAYCFSLPQSER